MPRRSLSDLEITVMEWQELGWELSWYARRYLDQGNVEEALAHQANSAHAYQKARTQMEFLVPGAIMEGFLQ